jgi:hypothetical protein
VNKKNIIELTGIYIILLGLSYSFYIILVAVKANDSIASSLLSWTATMFATIALLYTFNSWKKQKGSEVVANEAKELISKIIYIKEEIQKIIIESCMDSENNINKEKYRKLKDLYLSVSKDIIFIESIIDSESKILISNYLKSFFSLIVFSDLLFSEEKEDREFIINSILEKFDSFQKNTNHLLDELKNYALYIKTF